LNPFLNLPDEQRAVWNPGTPEMSLPVIEAVGIRPGMRVLEIGGGSGQVACILAKHWDVMLRHSSIW
jgi:protein-L-isoaspartate O-methyltransferase